MLALAVAVLAALRLSRMPPAEPAPPTYAPPPATLDADAVRYWLQQQAPDFAVVDAPGRPGCFVFSDPSADPKALMTSNDARAGWVLCEPADKPGPPRDLGPCEFVLGPYHFAGDPELIARLKPLFLHPPAPEPRPLAGGPEPPAPDVRALLDGEVVATYDLATMHAPELAALDGRRARFRVCVDSSVDRRGDRDVFEAVVWDRADGLASVWLYAGGKIEDDMVVEGTLRVLRRPALVFGGEAFAAFTEYRVVDAVRR